VCAAAAEAIALEEPRVWKKRQSGVPQGSRGVPSIPPASLATVPGKGPVTRGYIGVHSEDIAGLRDLMSY
jgi:hypothetical protein